MVTDGQGGADPSHKERWYLILVSQGFKEGVISFAFHVSTFHGTDNRRFCIVTKHLCSRFCLFVFLSLILIFSSGVNATQPPNKEIMRRDSFLNSYASMCSSSFNGPLATFRPGNITCITSSANILVLGLNFSFLVTLGHKCSLALS